MEGPGDAETPPGSLGRKTPTEGLGTAPTRNGMGPLSSEQPLHECRIHLGTRDAEELRNLTEEKPALLRVMDRSDQPIRIVNYGRGGKAHRRPSMAAYQLASSRHSMIASHISPMP